MKHFFLLLFAAGFSLCTSAQQMLKVWHNGEVVYERLVAETDSISFEAPAAPTPVFRYGYSFLDEKEKEIYDYVLDHILHYEDNATTYGDLYHRAYLNFSDINATLSINDVISYLNLIMHDVPEAFHLGSTIPRAAGNNTYYARLTKVFTPDVYADAMEQIEAITEEILSGLRPDMSEYEKIRYVHDAYIDYGDYGGMNDANGGNLYGGLINRHAVCEGLSRTFLYLCQRAGLKCVYVSGSLLTNTANETWTNHAWNFVQLEGKWYMVDITEDGGFPGYTNYISFLVGQKTFDQGHRMTSTDGSNPNACYKEIPTLSEEDYPWK